ncbi:hypothetical protein CHH80_13770 [Bacillus sp. 7504-2]|nr:hypothetical protein CHH80_13770 [Bacillus sp. 7504-2]
MLLSENFKKTKNKRGTDVFYLINFLLKVFRKRFTKNHREVFKLILLANDYVYSIKIQVGYYYPDINIFTKLNLLY